MTTYTIIWQDEGQYIRTNYDYGPNDEGYLRGELTIEYFEDRTVALTRFAELQHTGDTKETLTLLVNGRDHWDTDECDEIQRNLDPLLTAAEEDKKLRLAAEKEARAQAAMEEARRQAAKQRAEDERQLAVLQQRLGIK